MEIFRRKIRDDMIRWKGESDGRTALMIEGARRVGKSTIVRVFAERCYSSHIIIDFSAAGDTVLDIFERYRDDLDKFFLYLQSATRTELIANDGLIVFDDVQLYPKARQMIKSLVADGRFHYIDTGSLISIRRNVKDILIPSEDISIQMHPMDFEEFMWAMDDSTTVPLIRDAFERRAPLGPMHERIMDDYMLYMMIGGMPQAVETFLETRSFDRTDMTKRAILQLYSKDILKINGGGSESAGRILSRVPALLSRHDKTFSPSEIRADSRTRDYLRAVHWLDESDFVNVCYDVSDPDSFLRMNIDEMSFKMYMLDTGLLVTATMGSDIGGTESI